MSANSSLDLQRFYPTELEIVSIEENSDEIRLHMLSRLKSFCCLKCGKELHKLHATHHRTVQDLPILGKRVFLDIRVHDFQCKNDSCEIGAFSETFHGFLNHYSRMTERLIDFVTILLPDCMQIADRFHLHQNLLEAVKNVVNSTVPVDIKIPKDYASTHTEATFPVPSAESGKKMPETVDNSVGYNSKSVQLYNSIQEYAAAGYSKREIAKILHCGRNTVTKYLNGNYESLCRKNYRRGMDQFYDDIVKELSAGVSRKDVYCHLLQKGYKGKHSAAYDYINKIIKRNHIDIAVYKSPTPEAILLLTKTPVIRLKDISYCDTIIMF